MPRLPRCRRKSQFYGDTRAAIKKHSGEELDIKPYEADMRHLLNTYVQADPAADLGNLSSLSLTELIIETGIHDAIARKLNAKGKLSSNAIAEGIINNVRKTIIRDQLTDPRFYAEMSKLLDDLIKQSRDDAAAYEQFLKDAEALVKRLARKQPTAGVPAVLHGKPEAIVLFNNLASIPATTFQCPTDDEEKATLALELDRAMREQAPAGWKGDETREKQVLNALFPLMSRDRAATQAIFEIIKNQAGLLMTETIQIGELSIQVTRKDIKNVHLSVHPPDGRVTLAAPTRNAPRRGPRLRHQQARLDSRAAAEAAEPGARNAPAVRRTRKPLPLGTALSADGRPSRTPSPA